MAKKQLKPHEIESLEKIIRKAVRRDGGWTKGVSTLDKNAAKAAMAKLGRKRPEWDKTINLGMVNEANAIRSKTGHNSID